MFATATISLHGAPVAVIHNAQNFDMVRGAVADVVLGGITGRVDWLADNDEVLAINDDMGLNAHIVATAVDHSHIELQQRGRTIGTLLIRVFKNTSDEAVTLGGSIGPEVPDTQ